MESHIRDLQEVLGALQDAGFTLRGSKCAFGKRTITHLGFQYGPTGVSPSPNRTRTIGLFPNLQKNFAPSWGLLTFINDLSTIMQILQLPLQILLAAK